MCLTHSKEHIPDDWNGKLNLPALDADLTPRVANGMTGLATATFHAEMKNKQRLWVAAQFKPNELESILDECVLSSYSEQRYVISRIIGRSDLSNDYSEIIGQTSSGKDINLRDEIDAEFQRDLNSGKRSLDEICWIESEECWICNRFSTNLTVLTVNDIEQCFYDEKNRVYPNLQKLSEMQERIFNKLASQAGVNLQALEIGVPYVIGPQTSQRFQKMGSLVDLMISVDPEADKVRVKTSNDRTLLHDVYSGSWQTVLRNSFEKGK